MEAIIRCFRKTCFFDDDSDSDSDHNEHDNHHQQQQRYNDDSSPSPPRHLQLDRDTNNNTYTYNNPYDIQPTMTNSQRNNNEFHEQYLDGEESAYYHGRRSSCPNGNTHDNSNNSHLFRKQSLQQQQRSTFGLQPILKLWQSISNGYTKTSLHDDGDDDDNDNDDDYEAMNITSSNNNVHTTKNNVKKNKHVYDKILFPSPLHEAKSSSLSINDIPTISLSEVVMPGSDLQKQMMMSLQKQGYHGESEEDECVICMEGFDETNPRMPTLCGCGENKTYFHLPCLYHWIEQSRECPSCRKNLTWQEF